MLPVRVDGEISVRHGGSFRRLSGSGWWHFSAVDVNKKVVGGSQMWRKISSE